MSFTIHTNERMYPKVRQIDRQLWRIKEPFIALWDRRIIRLNEGFEFDGASIPRLFWSLVGSPMSGRYTAATAIHDGLYAVQLTGRLEADRCMYDIARDYGTRYIHAQTMLRAVQAWSWGSWVRHQQTGRVEHTRESELVDVIDMRPKDKGHDANDAT